MSEHIESGNNQNDYFTLGNEVGHSLMPRQAGGLRRYDDASGPEQLGRARRRLSSVKPALRGAGVDIIYLSPTDPLDDIDNNP